MTQNEKTLAAFEARVRQLILRFQELKKENEELYQMVALKMAKMMEISDGDLQGAKDRLSKLIREVNKCISMLQGD